MTPRRRLGLLAFGLFLGAIPLANWMILHVGTTCLPQGPCLIPVAPGILAPSGVALVGFALVLRDMVQRCLGLAAGIAAIALGTLATLALAPASLAIASAAGFAISEAADCAIYTPLQRRGLMRAVIASGLVGLVLDSVVFLGLAFGSLALLPGQVLGKLWAMAIALPLIRLTRRFAPLPA